ncbi:RNA polymerase subunit sigma-70 [Pedobacter yulinensis]|uniref:RNA polymerase subunit sigma-70 n=1 Tax=Pedobacter yulinensis TaxID=2126353 RepID=A0A2T3HN90_9SPHI|nr:sigma-70 family RNA polymerase sigma factor [Pedobacter yulinensis]PST83863.1 RNA polymerase subunit sigma-70 [Pedobacter yulinensis]
MDAQHTDQQRAGLFVGLYKKAFPATARYISRHGGSLDDARDIFQDALLLYYEKYIAGTKTPPEDESAYLLGICRNLWLKRFQAGLRLNNLEAAADDLAEEQPERTSEVRLRNLLRRAGSKCLDLLSAFYYHGRTMTEIAAVFGFSSPHSAAAQKHKCLEKVKQTVKQKSLQYEDILE